MKRGQIIVDGDPILYTAGFAAETAVYEIVYEDHHGTLRTARIEGDPRPFKKDLASIGGVVLQQERIAVPKPEGHARMMASAVVKHIIRVGREHLDDPYAELSVILSGSGNFRERIATVRGYKANRIGKPKPVHYQALREYLTRQWGGFVVHGREADDEVSIRMHRAAEDGIPSLLATIDKDLDQIPGQHYDYKQHVHYTVGAVDAQLVLYAQILSGDATDNVPGALGIGPDLAKPMVEAWQKEISYLEDDPEWGSSYPKEMWRRIVAEYEKRGVKDYTGPKTPRELALEMARLVKLQEYPGQLWTPDGPDELLEPTLDD